MITLFTVIQCGYERHFKVRGWTLNQLLVHFRRTELPFVDMPGELVGGAEYAELEQGCDVDVSITADMDNDQLVIYKIDGIPEGARTDDNVQIEYHRLMEYLCMLEVRLQNPEVSSEETEEERIKCLGKEALGL